MFPVSMFSMKMYPIDTVNCFPVLPEETLVVRYRVYETGCCKSGGGYGPNGTHDNIRGRRTKG